MDLSPDMMKSFLETKIAFVQRMGLKVLELERGRVKLSAPLSGNENHIGTMYAGALFTLAEIPGGALFLSTFDASKYYPIVKEVNIRFRRPVTTDATIEIRLPEDIVQRIQAEVEEQGKADFVLEGEIRDRHGEVSALSRGVYQLRKIGN